MNALVQQQAAALPAHLAALAGRNTALSAMGGITAGQSIYQISIKGSKWRKQDLQGNEEIVPTHHVDVLIVDANPNLSKTYYIGKYNPAETEAKAPDCYSDNGVAPSSRASAPQSPACATCPHNVWGSRVTDAGGQTRACADSKKLAVIMADNPTGPVYLLKIPPASLKNLYSFVESLQNRGIPLPAIQVRLGFDPNADYPKITFSPLGWASEDQMGGLTKVLGTDELKVVIGTNDKPRDPNVALAAPTPAIAAPTPAPFIPVQAPTPAHASVTPMVAADPFAQFANPPAIQNAAPPAERVVTPADGVVKRKRRTKAEIEAEVMAKARAEVANGQGAAQAAATSVAADPFAHLTPSSAASPLADIPQHMQQPARVDVPNAAPAAAATQINPAPTNTALDDLIAKALSA